MSEQKKAITSRTLWFNVAVAAFTVLAEQSPALRATLDDGGYLLAMLLIATVNAWLRTLTTSGVTLK